MEHAAVLRPALKALPQAVCRLVSFDPGNDTFCTLNFRSIFPSFFPLPPFFLSGPYCFLAHPTIPKGRNEDTQDSRNSFATTNPTQLNSSRAETIGDFGNPAGAPMSRDEERIFSESGRSLHLDALRVCE